MPPSVEDEEIIAVLRDSTSEELSTTEVAQELPIKRGQTRTRLQRLVDDGRIERRRDGNKVVWWLAERAGGATPAAEDGDDARVETDVTTADGGDTTDATDDDADPAAEGEGEGEGEDEDEDQETDEATDEPAESEDGADTGDEPTDQTDVEAGDETAEGTDDEDADAGETGDEPTADGDEETHGETVDATATDTGDESVDHGHERERKDDGDTTDTSDGDDEAAVMTPETGSEPATDASASDVGVDVDPTPPADVRGHDDGSDTARLVALTLGAVIGLVVLRRLLGRLFGGDED